jgi:hypothetical protein
VTRTPEAWRVEMSKEIEPHLPALRQCWLEVRQRYFQPRPKREVVRLHIQIETGEPSAAPDSTHSYVWAELVDHGVIADFSSNRDLTSCVEEKLRAPHILGPTPGDKLFAEGEWSIVFTSEGAPPDPTRR